MNKCVIEVKGEMSVLNVLHLYSANLADIEATLRQQRDRLPQAFEQSPLIVDCQKLDDNYLELDLIQLKQLLLDLKFIPVGLRHWPEAQQAQALDANWALLRQHKSAPVIETKPTRRKNTTISDIEIVEKPLRSGQQIYHPQGDVVLFQHTSAGSEILAGGSVHVYGSLRGRVLAGINGDTQARIFCQKLNAELVAIAGHYRLLDDIETDLKGQPAMVWLEGERLRISPM
ncbi:MAG: septum site-determining protein MinC [Candidatus Thiocaldithrix dubininis]|uniref:Probable septum site-determining protein MinC n=1 Tax=Candidatus Thiocaldithrix dubininis TaxID=3080823 RepID=A0AA95KJD0_9GAMM|nr:MAG: septum site-determining protein MinC [Candidatus Thiocaldithrix dubininis]